MAKEVQLPSTAALMGFMGDCCSGDGFPTGIRSSRAVFQELLRQTRGGIGENGEKVRFCGVDWGVDPDLPDTRIEFDSAFGCHVLSLKSQWVLTKGDTDEEV